MTNEKMLQVVNQMLKEKISTMELLKIKQQLELDVLKDAGKTVGKAKLQTVALKILKKAQREEWRGAWISNGKQYFINGFLGVELNSPLPLPEVGKLERIEGMFGEGEKELALPDASEVLGQIKLQQAEGKITRYYDFGEGLPLVDAELLRDVLSLMPDAKATYNNLQSAIQFNSSIGRAILMPVRRVKQ